MRLDKANSQSSDLYLDIQVTISVAMPAYLILIHHITLLYATVFSSNISWLMSKSVSYHCFPLLFAYSMVNVF